VTLRWNMWSNMPPKLRAFFDRFVATAREAIR
jgi:hypothetical protein